uniref:Uncharacterized protein n=1 Tax=Opuntia streptacantha TaxID=393608 RepID=A0A7C9DEC0_OPUST
MGLHEATLSYTNKATNQSINVYNFTDNLSLTSRQSFNSVPTSEASNSMLKLPQMTDVGNTNTTQKTTITFGVGLALARHWTFGYLEAAGQPGQGSRQRLSGLSP